MCAVDGWGVGSRVQPVHAPGLGFAFHGFNTLMLLSQSLPRTQGPFLMAALRTGFQLIMSANLPQGRRSTRKHMFGLKAKMVERLSHAWRILDGGRKKEKGGRPAGV